MEVRPYFEPRLKPPPPLAADRKPKYFPPHLKAAIEAAGVRTDRPGVGVRPKLGTCLACGGRVWVFLDMSTPMVYPVRVIDSFPITSAVEFWCVMTGVATWRWDVTSPTPLERWPGYFATEGRRADDHPVYPTHRCGVGYPVHEPMAARRREWILGLLQGSSGDPPY